MEVQNPLPQVSICNTQNSLFRICIPSKAPQITAQVTCSLPPLKGHWYVGAQGWFSCPRWPLAYLWTRKWERGLLNQKCPPNSQLLLRIWRLQIGFLKQRMDQQPSCCHYQLCDRHVFFLTLCSISVPPEGALIFHSGILEWIPTQPHTSFVNCSCQYPTISKSP